MESDVRLESPVIITRFPGFTDLYADSGVPEPEAPKSKENLKFRAAVDQMDDLDLAAIREYDRARYGGIVGYYVGDELHMLEDTNE